MTCRGSLWHHPDMRRALVAWAAVVGLMMAGLLLSASPAHAKPAENAVCSTPGSTTIGVTGALLECKRNSAGSLVWLAKRISLSQFEQFPKNGLVSKAKLGKSCSIEGQRALVGALWDEYVCAVSPKTLKLTWQKNRLAHDYAGQYTGDRIPGRPCKEETSGLGLQCVKGSDGKLTWGNRGAVDAPPITASWPYQAGITAQCGPRVINGATMENYRIYQHSFAVDPNNPRVVWAAVEKMGLFQSSDAGATWRQVTIPGYETPFRTTDGALCWPTPTISFGGPGNSTTYVSTWSGPGSMNANRWMSWSGLGAGVASTSDRGASWRNWAATRVNAFGTSFAVDPTNPRVWYWGHGTQLGGFSDDLGGEAKALASGKASWLTTGFIEKSTDGGRTWKQLPTGLDWPLTRVAQIIIDPRSPQTLTVVLFQNRAVEPLSGKQIAPLIIRSTDGGASWTPLVTNSLGSGSKSATAVSSDGANIVVCAQGDVPTDSCFVSNDRGASFRQVARRMGAVSANPSNPSQFIAYGAPNSVDRVRSDAIYRSDDGGLSWTRVADAPAGFRMDGGDETATNRLEGIFWSADGSMYVTGDKATIVKSTDGGVTWAPLTSLDTFRAVKRS